MMKKLLEFAVPFFEWLGWERFYRPLKKALLGLTVLSVMFSTMHQSALGSLFIIAPGKLHPLWYSGQIFLFFFISAVIAGISMVIVESTLSHKIFFEQFEGHHVDVDKLTLGLAKAGAVVMFAYFFLKLQGVVDNHALGLIGVGFYGKWWLVEMLGFVLLPSLMFAWGARNQHVTVVRVAAILGVLGIVLNRLNVSLVAYNYNQAVRYWPSWMEIAVSLALVVAGVLAFRWIVNRMPTQGMKPGKIREILIPAGEMDRVFLDRLVKEDNPERILEAIKGESVYPVIAAGFAAAITDESFAKIENELYKEFYANLLSEAMSGFKGGKQSLEYILLDIDMINIRNMFRLRADRMKEKAGNMMIPGGTFSIGDFEDLIALDDQNDFIEALKSKVKLKPLLALLDELSGAKSLREIEIDLIKVQLAQMESLSKLNPFSIHPRLGADDARGH